MSCVPNGLKYEMKVEFSSRTARGLLTNSKTILMDYSCLALVKVSLNYFIEIHGWYFEGTSVSNPSLYSIHGLGQPVLASIWNSK